jgi:hypothetical protein
MVHPKNIVFMVVLHYLVVVRLNKKTLWEGGGSWRL